jgi:hypothetical protein
MKRLLGWPSHAAAFLLAVVVNAFGSGEASAHVKWFCAFSVAGEPRSLENVLCPDFEVMIALSVLALMSGSLLEGTPVGLAMVRAMDRATAFVRDNTEILFRAGCAFFFISIWAVGGILLTPELKTSSSLVAMLHLAIAAGMLSRRTMPFSALGIAIIFAIAIWTYGAFHLADYPLFLGVAVYLALTGAQQDFFGIRAMDLVRWSAGITLMWASIEKWAYPEWSFPLLAQHPGMTLGFDAEFFMRAAGAIEFALAFALLWTPLVRRLAATMLTGMFVAAIFEFGKLDMIGHMLIIVVLVAIVADNGGKTAEAHSWKLRYSWLVPVAYTASLALFLASYYLGHSLIYGTPVL